jgi:hypothetical protein
MEFKYNDKVKQINPCPWISGGVYNPTERRMTYEDTLKTAFQANPPDYSYTHYIAGKCELTSAQDHTFLFKKQWKHKPHLCYCQGEATGRVYTFKIDSIVLA